MTKETRTAVEDSALVARAKAGEADAFGQLYEKYVTMIYRYIRGKVALDSDAEDLTENVFMRSLEGLDRYEDRGFPYSAYLYRVARNAVTDHYRGNIETIDIEAAGRQASDWSPVEDEIAKNETLQSVARTFSRLTEEQKEVVYLRVVLGYPTSSVAEWLGRSEGSVRVLLHRSLKQLRAMVEDSDDLETPR